MTSKTFMRTVLFVFGFCLFFSGMGYQAYSLTTEYPFNYWRTFNKTGDIPGTPRGIVFHPNSQKAYVVAEFDDAIYEINTNGDILRTLKLDSWQNAVYEPKYIVINSTGTRLYVTCYTRESVFVIDAVNWSVITELRSGYNFYNPAGIAISPDDNYIYVANTGETYDNGLNCKTGHDSLMKIRTLTYGVQYEVYPSDVGFAVYDLPAEVLVSHDGSKVFVSIYGCNSIAKRFIYVFNSSDLSVLTAIDCNVSGQPDHLRMLGMDITTDDKYLYAVSEYRARLLRINISNLPSYSVDWFYDLGTTNVTDPRDVELFKNGSTGNEFFYVSLSGNEEQPIESYTIKVFKHRPAPQTPLFYGNITTPYRAPEALAISPDGKFLAASHWDRHAVTLWSIYTSEDLPTIGVVAALLLVLLLSLLLLVSRNRAGKSSETR